MIFQLRANSFFAYINLLVIYLSYSNKQHRGNEGEGQFHITNKNIKYHLDNYLVKIITYDDVYNKLTKNIK